MKVKDFLRNINLGSIRIIDSSTSYEVSFDSIVIFDSVDCREYLDNDIFSYYFYEPQFGYESLCNRDVLAFFVDNKTLFLKV